jgi:hypothetical protein
MTVNDKRIAVHYLGFGYEPPREPEADEEVVCVPRDGQTIDEAAKEMLQDVFSVHLQEGLPGPVRFGELVPLFKVALTEVELEPVDSSDCVHWFVLRWTDRPN